MYSKTHRIEKHSFAGDTQSDTSRVLHNAGEGTQSGTPLFLQRSPICSTPDIKREPGDEEEQGFQFEPWPPSVGYRRGPFSISATTSAAQLGYRYGPASYSLGYQYGSDIYTGLNVGGFSSRLGVNPSEGNVLLKD